MASDDHDLDELLDSALDDFKHVDINRASTNDDAQTNPPSIAGQGSEESVHPQPSGASGSSAASFSSSSSFSPSPSSSAAGPASGLGMGLPSLHPVRKPKGNSKQPKVKSKGKGNGNGEVPATASRPLSSTLEKLAEQTRQTVDSMDPGEDGELDAAMADKLVQQLEALGGTDDVQSLMDSVMRQLLSKEVLHEPMQEIGDRYPSWLEANRNSLNEEDYQRYTQQHRYIQELCEVYSNSPNDFERIVDLMQQMQKCGQPPADIIKELAPGVKLGEDGLPILEDSTPGMEGLPPNCGMM